MAASARFLRDQFRVFAELTIPSWTEAGAERTDIGDAALYWRSNEHGRTAAMTISETPLSVGPAYRLGRRTTPERFVTDRKDIPAER